MVLGLQERIKGVTDESGGSEKKAVCWGSLPGCCLADGSDIMELPILRLLQNVWLLC